ncbi:MAG: D-glycero-beta-D-manno-heptose 1-phosphate adenylyltransferase [Candidatus Omnitrophica bacterium]|nr:D-glycero-beta-D-manno-heptose 1-phosphate adenylyltransferase [Candidatus Omnitrophota bacterium]MDD5310695.1 D-glycero-beta-D-manno-heptose 1-phosphate adenylyltransferase [Candidatus Omnitrophota bacterium]MDD5545699.1 D-glycero-beta-D-manno-heptose 1-phosphate adenylyltransferase [Candidatus Omnitrophota bacterium]
MTEKKITSFSKLKALASRLRAKGKRIVFTNGCFDILHAGHVKYLEKARSLGDVLVLGLNSDRSVKKIKGPSRPIIPQKDRAAVVASLGFVDYVVIFGDATPLKLIKAVRPYVLVKGADWKVGKIVGADLVKSYGGKVVAIPLVKGRSTTGLIRRILNTADIRGARRS